MKAVKKEDNNYNCTVKLIIIGDSGVGKTNILLKFCDNEFKLNYVATIGVDFKIKTVQIEDKRIKFQIWDTAGQERFKNINQTYYKGAIGIILAYSIIDAKSFDNVEKWMDQIHTHSSSGVKKILVGNKSDLQQQRKVSKEAGAALAEKYGMQFLEVSAKSGNNIDDIFQKLGAEIKIRLDQEERQQMQKKKGDEEAKKKVVITSQMGEKPKQGNCSC